MSEKNPKIVGKVVKKTQKIMPTCRVPFRRGGSGPWMQRGVHSRPAPGWTRYVYIEHTCGTVGRSTSEGHQRWSDCHPRARDSVTDDLYPDISYTHSLKGLQTEQLFTVDHLGDAIRRDVSRLTCLLSGQIVPGSLPW